MGSNNNAFNPSGSYFFWMKRSRKPSEIKQISDRIVFFDILRILFISFIVYGHMHVLNNPWLNALFQDGYTPFSIYPISLGTLALYGMFFISGAVIEYHYKKIKNASEHREFLFRRFIRLYPAFWMSLIFGILLFPSYLQAGMLPIIIEFSGFYSFIGPGLGLINQMGWFIGAVVCLYIVYPWITKILEKHGFTALVIIMIISFSTRVYLLTINPLQIPEMFKWFPLCNLFEFCLGIYIVKKKWYPVIPGEFPTLRKLSELSFYVFLFHVIIIKEFLGLNFPSYIPNQWVILFFYATVLIISGVAMVFDKQIQNAVFRNCWVKKNFGI